MTRARNDELEAAKDLLYSDKEGEAILSLNALIDKNPNLAGTRQILKFCLTGPFDYTQALLSAHVSGAK